MLERVDTDSAQLVVGQVERVQIGEVCEGVAGDEADLIAGQVELLEATEAGEEATLQQRYDTVLNLQATQVAEQAAGKVVGHECELANASELNWWLIWVALGAEAKKKDRLASLLLLNHALLQKAHGALVLLNIRRVED